MFVSDRWRKTTVVYDFLAACKNILTIFSLFQLCSNRTVSSLFFFFCSFFRVNKAISFRKCDFQNENYVSVFRCTPNDSICLFYCSQCNYLFYSTFFTIIFFSFFQYFRFVYCGACVCVFYFFSVSLFYFVNCGVNIDECTSWSSERRINRFVLLSMVRLYRRSVNTY